MSDKPKVSKCKGCDAWVQRSPGTRGRPRKFCTLRCQRENRRRPVKTGFCVDCGNIVLATSIRCHTCERKRSAYDRCPSHTKKRATIEMMWAAGCLTREIEAVVGSTINIATARARGYDLPHRRTPEQIARMTADNGAHLASARLAKSEMRAAA